MDTKLRFDLVCFDVDGTMVRHPTDKVIWEILNLRFIGNDGVNQQRYRMYHDGEITYAEWVKLDVEGWIEAGATRESIVETVREFKLLDGVRDTVMTLNDKGVHLAIISGTLDVVIDTLFPDHPFEDVYSNRLGFDDQGRLESWQATSFDLHGKPEALRELAEKHNVSLERVAFVGDGDNDVHVVGVAGCVVAFNPRSNELERRADHVFKGPSMSPVLDVLA